MTKAEEVRSVPKGAWSRVIHLITSSRIPWLLIALTVVLSLVSTWVGMLYPDYQTRILDGDLSTSTIQTAVLLLAASIVISLISRYAMFYTQNLISKRVLDRVWAKILTLPITIFHKTSPRELISRTTSDTQALGDIFVVGILGLITDFYALYLALGYVFSYHTTLGWLQLALIPLFILLKVIQGRIMFKQSYRLQDKLAGLTQYMSQILINIPLVKVFVKEDHEIERGQAAIRRYNKSRFQIEGLRMFFIGIDNIFMAINTILAVVVGVFLIRKGELTISTWVAFYMYSQSVNVSLLMITDLWPLIKDTQGGVTRIADFMQAESEDYAGTAINEPVGDIVFENVDFSYSSQPVLRGVNLTIPHNSLTALVGQSGAGKTTILGMLERFFIPDQGRITLDGVDIQSIALQDWRRNFAYITQEKNLFAGTIRENLIYGIEREVSEEEILLALRAASILERVQEMPEGLDTMIGEGGSTISGGESQRIALARIMLKQPPILLLHEATANLDAESECRVLDSLDLLYEGRTSIAVAHRLSTVIHADHIIVLGDGEVLGQGTHEELMAGCPEYARLVETELQSNEEANPCK